MKTPVNPAACEEQAFDLCAPEVAAPAKINWILRVGDRRPDGYHEVQTILQPVDLHDILTFQRAESFLFTCSDPALAGEDNLVCRAWRLLREEFPEKVGGVRIHLEKRIPAQAGLGGGSSDAAAALLRLDLLFALGLSREQLARLAARLGADVPALLYAQATYGSGTGTQVQPVRTRLAAPLLIVKPDCALPTAAMYRRIDARRADIAGASQGALKTNSGTEAFRETSEAASGLPREMNALLRALEKDDIPALAEHLKNDFEEVLGEEGEQIRAAKTALLREGACAALLSGSGSAVFGLFENEAARDRAKTELGKRFKVFACRTLNRE